MATVETPLVMPKPCAPVTMLLAVISPSALYLKRTPKFVDNQSELATPDIAADDASAVLIPNAGFVQAPRR
ncbi:hypothetical protein D3C86_1925710 [compost metagenome]